MAGRSGKSARRGGADRRRSLFMRFLADERSSAPLPLWARLAALAAVGGWLLQAILRARPPA